MDPGYRVESPEMDPHDAQSADLWPLRKEPRQFSEEKIVFLMNGAGITVHVSANHEPSLRPYPLYRKITHGTPKTKT